MMAWLIALLVLGVLVLVHEFGHFVVARWCGVRVVRFSIGFGPTLLRWRRGETEYALCLLPLGGYVKMAGEQHTTQTRAPGEFLSQPAGIRARIIIAGPFVNVLTSLVTLWTVTKKPLCHATVSWATWKSRSRHKPQNWQRCKKARQQVLRLPGQR